MKKLFYNKSTFTLLFFTMLLSSCNNSNQFDESVYVEHTLFIYMPWASDLTSFFETNLEDIETAFEQKNSADTRIVVFFADSEISATLYELRYVGKKIKQINLKEYNVGTLTSAEGIAALMEELKYYAPSDKYSMIIGAHGTGWIPVYRTYSAPTQVTEHEEKVPSLLNEKMHWEYKDAALTRYFGGGTTAYQIDITEFAEGLKNSNMVMEYILFDDCFMANLESAYDLRDVTKYIIASPTEIMAYGFPYSEVGTYLLGDINYEAIVNRFIDFYSTYTYPYATIGVIDCGEIENMAEIALKINSDSTSINPDVSNIQKMDGYSPTIFFDYENYISQRCKNEELLAEFQTCLDKLVIYKGCTTQYYSAIVGGTIDINSYSGITTSQPTQHSVATFYTDTNWYKATNN